MAELTGNISGLSCSVCYNSYKTSEENNVPRSLSCGHTYCTGCLEKLISERHDAVIIRCPTCKRETVLLTPQPGCSRDLPKNFGLLDIVSIYENNEEEPTAETSASQSSHSDDKPICKEHDEPMKVYCHTDECLICIYCQVYGDHVGHDCQLACQLVKKRKESVENIHEKLKEYLYNLVLAKVNNSRTFTRITQHKDSLQERISEHFKNLHDELDKREKCLKRRLHTKTGEQTKVLLCHERTWSNLIIKGYELRTHCRKVLRSTDYSILTEEKSICESVDEFATLISNSQIDPFPSCNLTWTCAEELADAIKFHGHIREEPVSEEDELDVQELVLDDDEEEIVVSEEDELDEREAVLDDDEEEIVGAVGRDPSREHNRLIRELTSELGREIQRLEMIYLPVEIQVLSDSSCEDDEVQDMQDGTRRPDTEDCNEPENELWSSFWARLCERQRPVKVQCVQQEPEREQQPQQQQQQQQQDQHEHERDQQHDRDQQQRYRQHHHHYRREHQHNHHPTTHRPCGSCSCQQPQNIAVHDVCKVSNLHNKCLRSKCKRSQYSPRSHRQRGNHSCSKDEEAEEEDSSLSICGSCHMVNDNTNPEMCSKCTDHAVTVANCDNICPMCTLANETGKSKCELCGFHLPI